ncbi:MAG: T9SS type A sorting domain-containing protein, partial [Bacteroidales bacterium]|nr:T9SS type A sorting domain-containing protein [Bacteroidales bacterium]
YLWNFLPVGGDLSHFRLAHSESKRWLHCMEDGVSTFELGPFTWVGERTRWKLVSIADDSNHVHIEHKASGKWLNAASDGSNLVLASSESKGDDSRWQIIYSSSNVLSHKQYNANDKIKLYPNPANTHLKLQGTDENMTIFIYNCQGQMVKQVLSSADVTKINISDMNSGLYFVTFSDTRIATQKLIVR